MSAVETLSVTRTVMVAAPVEKVWEAVTRPAHIARWASFSPSIDRVAVGGVGEWVLPTYGSMPIVIEALDPLKSITYRWGPRGGSSTSEPGSTVFTFTLAAVEGRTSLTVVESGFEALPDPETELDAHTRGWESGLESLSSVIGETP